MKLLEHLLVCGMEEAGEITTASLAVAKAFSKVLRFGPGDINPMRRKTAVGVLVAELNDQEAVIELLQEAGLLLPGLHDREAIERKKDKVRHFIKHAEQNGTVI